MSRLLLDEHPLMVMPNLAKAIGLNEAIVLQQIHYWNEMNKKTNNNFKDGYYWTFNSYDGWCEQFPFWSEHTIRRAINNLEKMGLLIAGNYNKLKIDRTKWYRIDYEKLDKWDKNPCGQNGQVDIAKWTDGQSKMGRPLPETPSEIPAKSKKTLPHLDAGALERNELIELVSVYTQKRFDKPLRETTGYPDLEIYQSYSGYEVVEILEKNIKNYNQCNLDYLSTIQERFK